MMSDDSTKDPPCLVVGDDGSPSADVAWLWVNNHHWPGWRLRVITGDSGPVPASAWGEPARVETWESPWGRTYFHASELSAIEHLHTTADPRVALDEQRDARLVVVGRRGLGPARSFWKGSTTDWLLQYPSIPLALIRSANSARHVTCCVDGSPHSLRAVEAFAALPLAASADVTVLAIDDEHVDVDAAIGAGLAALGDAGIEGRAETARGKAPHVLLERCTGSAPDLLVLGTKGLTVLDRLRLGSTAAAVVHHSPANCIVACVDPHPQTSGS